MTTIANNIGYVYKIVCNDVQITDCYVGLCRDMAKKKCQHKSNYNNPNSKAYNINMYKFIRNNGGWANWSMIQIERIEYIFHSELKSRKKYHLERLGATLNKQIPSTRPAILTYDEPSYEEASDGRNGTFPNQPNASDEDNEIPNIMGLSSHITLRMNRMQPIDYTLTNFRNTFFRRL